MVSLNGEALSEKVLSGERISVEDAGLLSLFPLEELGELATARRNLAKATAYGGRGREIVTYIVDRNINYTNVCNVYCKFCAFYRTEKDDDHYVLSLEQIDQKLDELSAIGGVQILMQGGHHPKLASMVPGPAASHPEQVSAHQHPRILSAGVQSFRRGLPHASARSHRASSRKPGSDPSRGAAARFSVDRVRNKIAPLKCSIGPWLEVMQIAHELGLRSSATMMFGHVETMSDRIEHLERVADAAGSTPADSPRSSAGPSSRSTRC